MRVYIDFLKFIALDYEELLVGLYVPIERKAISNNFNQKISLYSKFDIAIELPMMLCSTFLLNIIKQIFKITMFKIILEITANIANFVSWEKF